MDGDADPRRYVALMDLARGGRDDDPAQYQNLFAALAPAGGERVLDVGCGTGGAVRALAQSFKGAARVVGLDVSETMVAEARARTAGPDVPCAPFEFVAGDAHALPFPAESFDAAFSLGVFEIVADPRRVLAEMARVLRAGGRLVVNGPDVDAWAIDSSDREVTRKVIHHACDAETNGWVGRQLPGWCRELGLTEVSATPVGVTVNTLDPLYEICLGAFVRNAEAAGAVTAAEAARWVEDLRERDRRGLFFCTQTFFRVSARKGSRR